MACVLLLSSALRVYDSQAYRKMDVTRERISRILELRGAERNTLVNPNWFQHCQCCCCLCYPGQYLSGNTDHEKNRKTLNLLMLINRREDSPVVKESRDFANINRPQRRKLAKKS